jgi:UDP-N-acetylglucosamine--N-acetylmuramyl-(pentapeptide) pyrophosphoryl-undecaprenol N-acetylglucosamine transferase
VIFATCGSSHLPFERFMRALATVPADELIVQHGPATPPPASRTIPFLPFAEMVELIEEADLVVSHAGVGSIICAVRSGHTPIVFPRLQRHGETVDDHQVELARALEQHGTVRVATDAGQLMPAIHALPARGVSAPPDAVRLNTAVRAAIYGETVVVG